MWFILGFFLLGIYVFSDSTIRGAGVILKNDDNQILLIQDTITKKYGFPKGQYESDDYTYYQNAVREMKEETTLELDKDYSLTPGSCRFGNHYYFFGTLLHNNTIPQINTVLENEHSDIQWFSLDTLPEKKTKGLKEWIEAGYPESCHHSDDEL